MIDHWHEGAADAPPVPLKAVIEGMEIGHDEKTPVYLDRQTGELFPITAQALRQVDAPCEEPVPSWQREERCLAERVLAEAGTRYLALPAPEEADERRGMERFCQSRPDPNMADTLWPAIQGRDAFDRFKALIHCHGLGEAWDRYRAEVFAEMARNWCAGHELRSTEDEGEPEAW